jgi:hypothetical protein
LSFRQFLSQLFPFNVSNFFLSPYAELRDDVLVPASIFRLQMIQQLAPLADKLEQAAPGMVILGVRFEMLRQVDDPLGQKSDLYLGGTGICFMLFVNRND